MTDWNKYYLNIAQVVSENSKCLSRKIGAVITVHNSIVSTGYNGPPVGVKHCEFRKVDKDSSFKNICPRKRLGYGSGQGLHICIAGHAERNALIQCAKLGISTLGGILYCYCPIPCKDCAIEIINAGIKKVVCLKGKDYDSLARELFQQACVELEEVEI